MPVHAVAGHPGCYRWGRHGKIYCGKGARAKSERQGRAIRASGFTGNKLVGELVLHQTSNALRTDPTRTSLIRRRFQAEMMRRVKKLIAALREFLIEKDALGLKQKKLGFAILAEEAGHREFEFRTDAEKLEAFNNWLKQQVEANLLSPSPGTPAGRPWLSEFIESAFKKGQLNAFLSSKQASLLEQEGVGSQTMESFLRSSFGQAEATSKARLLATRAFEDLKGVTSTMSSQMNQILAQGIIDGTGPAEIAREMVEKIGSLTEKRALVIARTETIAAHAEGQLDAFENLGVDELGVKAEWVTAGDDRVCPECHDMEGKVFDVEEARGLIPLHPNCRCTWVPFIPTAVENKFRPTAIPCWSRIKQ